MILMSALMLLLFIWHEKRVKNPLIDFNLYLKNRIFGYSNIAALINYSSTFSLIFLMSFYLQRVRLLSPYEAGTIMVIQPVFMALCSPLTGRLSDKFEARYLSTIGMSIAALGLLSLSWISAETPYWILMTIFAFLGIGFALFSSPNMNTIMSSVEKTQLGIASGSAATMRVVGQMVSMSISTLVIALFFAHADGLNISPEHFMEAMKIILYIGTSISLVGIYFSFSRGELRK
jgi:MFS family permease